LPSHRGLLNYFGNAENAFISAYRHHSARGNEFDVIVKYFAAQALGGKTLILTDPILATGKTLENVLNALKIMINLNGYILFLLLVQKQGILQTL